jgi:hypothetical protein
MRSSNASTHIFNEFLAQDTSALTAEVYPVRLPTHFTYVAMPSNCTQP